MRDTKVLHDEVKVAQTTKLQDMIEGEVQSFFDRNKNQNIKFTNFIQTNRATYSSMYFWITMTNHKSEQLKTNKYCLHTWKIIKISIEPL